MNAVKTKAKKSGYQPKVQEPLSEDKRQEIEIEIECLRLQMKSCRTIKKYLSIQGKIGALTLTLKGGDSRSRAGIAGMASRWKGHVKKS